MDNFYCHCPAKMQEGSRFLTEYKNDTSVNEYIKHINGIWRDDDYRDYLQANGATILCRERVYLNKKYNCKSTYQIHNFPTRVTNEELIAEKRKYDMRNHI